MVRSAAKNHAGVAVVTDPADYAALLDEMKASGGALATATRFALARRPSRTPRATTAAIADWLTGARRRRRSARRLPGRGCNLQLSTASQDAALRREPAPARGVLPRPRRRRAGSHRRARASCRARSCRYNNIADADAAWECVKTFDAPGLRDRQARQPVRRRDRRRRRSPPTSRRSRPTRPRPSAASSPSTARSTAPTAEACRATVRRGGDRARASTDGAQPRCADKKPTCACSTVPIAHGDLQRASNIKRVGGGLLVQTRDDVDVAAAS